MINKLSFQSFSIRNYMRNPAVMDAAFGEMRSFGYTECHGAFFMGNDFFAPLLKKHGIEFYGNNYDFGLIKNNPDEAMKLHEAWGTNVVGIGGIWGAERENYDNLMKFIEEFNEIANLFAKNGFKLTYHNHQFEFMRINGYKTIMDLMAENFNENVYFVFDTCWCAAGGADVCSWIEKLGKRIEILHLKDMTLIKENGCYTGHPTEIGNGNLDFDRIIATSEKVGIQHFCVEQDGDCYEQIESMRVCAENMKKYMA